MSQADPDHLIEALIGQRVVLDLTSRYVCLGTLDDIDRTFLALIDADVHDLRDGQSTREIYVYDAARLGIRRNRARVLIRRDEIVAITRFVDIAED